jgi:poly-gamma-glutamate synthesis protein (capsule biosynthesis protein)
MSWPRGACASCPRGAWISWPRAPAWVLGGWGDFSAVAAFAVRRSLACFTWGGQSGAALTITGIDTRAVITPHTERTRDPIDVLHSAPDTAGCRDTAGCCDAEDLQRPGQDLGERAEANDPWEDVMDREVTLFLCGDVMTGRGVDQILMRPSAPALHERNVRDARDYVALAEQASGPIPRSVAPTYVWGDALGELEAVAPAARIVNLELSLTGGEEYWPDKGINYRMHPANVTCLTAARIDVCALANNHVLDYGYRGLDDTLATLATAGVKSAGAGRQLAEAQRPAIVERPGGGRVIVFSFGTASSGIPLAWAATGQRPGVDLLEGLSEATAARVVERVHGVRRPDDVVVASIHWGGNWGYEVPRAHARFAHRLIDGGVDIVHGHSSHHPRPIEVYRDRLVLYGCGDFIDDYEGIRGYEDFRDDLVLMYFPVVQSPSGTLLRLRMVPLRIHRMRLHRASAAETRWLRARLDEVCASFGSSVALAADGSLGLRWGQRANRG